MTLKQPKFIEKLIEMLNETAHRDIITWASNGNGFVIKNMKGLPEILKYYFKSNKLKTFQKQLSLYSFKVTSALDLKIYTHKTFSIDSTIKCVRVKPQTYQLQTLKNELKQMKDQLSVLQINQIVQMQQLEKSLQIQQHLHHFVLNIIKDKFEYDQKRQPAIRWITQLIYDVFKVFMAHSTNFDTNLTLPSLMDHLGSDPVVFTPINLF